jgi:hypothetical protein
MEENQPIFDLQVDDAAGKNLTSASKWARFLAIVVFVCVGLLLIIFLTYGQQILNGISEVIPTMGRSAGTGVLAVIIIAALLIFVLMFLLFRGASLVIAGVRTKNQETLNNGLTSLKSYFIMWGILYIISTLFNLIGLFNISILK